MRHIGTVARRGHTQRAAPLAAVVALLLHGQTNAADAPASEGLGEITVTAQKRAESVQEAPLSVSAVSAEDLAERQVASIGDVSALSPGLSVGQQYGQNRTFIRGIGLTSFSLGADASTAFHVDGVYIGRPSAQLSAFFDLDRIEVVRGPQGTLYGRNATAGSINVITGKPTDSLEGAAGFTFGNYSHLQFDGMISGPLSDSGRVRGRLAVQKIEHDGYGRNEATGADIDDADTHAVRGTLDFALTDATRLTLSADYAKEDDSNYAAHFLGAYRSDVPLTGVLVGGALPSDERNVSSDVPVVNDRTNKGASATLSWSGGALGFNSITGYREFERLNRHDIDATSVDAGGALTWTEDSQQFSQELQLTYSGERLEGIVGAYYYDEDLAGRTFVDLGFFAPGATFDENGKVTTEAYALFAQGSYAVTPKLKLTLGARYSSETREADGAFSIFGQTFPSSGKKKWTATTPKVGIDYTTDAGVLLYASATKGFKSGLFNVGSLNPPIDPEYVWAYEAGVKSRLLDDRVELNAAAFYYDYKDLQVGRVVNTQLVTVNAAKAKNKGAEVSLRALPIDGLQLYAEASWLNAKFTEFNTADAARPELGELDLSGNYLPNSPKIAVNAGVDYTASLSNGSTLGFRVDGNWTDRVYFTEFNVRNMSQESVLRLNAAITLKSPGERWSLTAYGKNLTDETIVANNIIASILWGLPLIGSLEPPRTYGVRIGYQFGK